MTIRLAELCDPGFKRDPFPMLARLRKEGPLVDTKIPLIGKARLATTYEAVNQVLRDRQRFVIEARNAGRKRRHDFRWYLPGPIRALSNSMMQKDEPDHRRLRGLTEQAFRRKNVASMQSRINEITDDLVDRVSAEAVFDLVDGFARTLPLAVICELLGLPSEDRPRFSRWVQGLTNASIPWGLVTALPGVLKLNQYLKQRFVCERKNPSGGLISELVAAEEEGSQLNEDELLATVFLLLVAGHETTTHLISLAMLTFLSRPDLRDQWLDDPTVRSSAIHELLRFHSPVQMTKPRYATEDTTIDGAPIARGQLCIAMLAAANVDPAKFDSPEQIDLRRDPNPHVAFGSGIHFCAGAQLARMEAEIAITRLLERLPNASLDVPIDQIGWSGKLGIRIVNHMPIRTSAS